MINIVIQPNFPLYLFTLLTFHLKFHELISASRDMKATKGCYLGSEYHLPGSSWYPYLPPNGFDRCTVCTCNATTTEIKCPRQVCPTLRCLPTLAFRPNNTACCKVCPKVSGKKINDPTLMGDQDTEPIKSTEEILKQGGCKVTNGAYENGSEWQPNLPSIRRKKCIMCQCKVSHQSKPCLRTLSYEIVH